MVVYFVFVYKALLQVILMKYTILITVQYTVSRPLHMSPVDRVGSVTGMNFALGSYEKFQPGFRDEKRSKILGTSSGAKFGKQSKHGETQKF